MYRGTNTSCAMYKAAELLGYEHLAIKEIAVQVGYGFEVAFSQAFKRWASVAEDTYRRNFANDRNMAGEGVEREKTQG